MRSTVTRRPQVGLVTHFRNVTGSDPVTRLPVSVSPNPVTADWVERGIAASSARCLAASGITRTARRRVGRGWHRDQQQTRGVAALLVEGWHTPLFRTRR